jgi:hypothetical protein
MALVCVLDQISPLNLYHVHTLLSLFLPLLTYCTFVLVIAQSPALLVHIISIPFLTVPYIASFRTSLKDARRNNLSRDQDLPSTQGR